jgi:uroporphyrinogen-III synthase
MNVLLTRTTPFSESINEACLQRNIHIIHYPLIDIQETPNKTPLQNAIHNLAHYDIAIFMSKWAAHFTMQIMNEYHLSLDAYPKLVCAAIGPGTAKKLQAFNLSQNDLPVLIPNSMNYESESFLALAEMQPDAIKNKKIIIFRGNGGRDLIPDTLQKQGAELTLIETYIRQSPCLETGLTLLTHLDRFPELIIISSAYALNNLVILFSRYNNIIREHKINGWIWDIPMIVVGKRLLDTAKQLGFTKLILAIAADDQTLKDVVCENFYI